VPVQSALSNKANGAHYANSLETEHKVLDYVTLASMTDGYMATDMKDLVGGALQQAIMRVSRTGEGKVSRSIHSQGR
jgi:peroxin-1